MSVGGNSTVDTDKTHNREDSNEEEKETDENRTRQAKRKEKEKYENRDSDQAKEDKGVGEVEWFGEGVIGGQVEREQKFGKIEDDVVADDEDYSEDAVNTCDGEPRRSLLRKEGDDAGNKGKGKKGDFLGEDSPGETS